MEVKREGLKLGFCPDPQVKFAAQVLDKDGNPKKEVKDGGTNPVNSCPERSV